MILESEAIRPPVPTGPADQTIRLLVSIYVPGDCRIPSHQQGPLDAHMARCLTHALDAWLPTISTGRRPVALAMTTGKGVGK